MIYHPPTDALPRIFVGEREETRLTTLATSAMQAGRSVLVARVLLAEMERAEIVPDAALPSSVVRMNSRVVFDVDGGDRREGVVVFPGEANIDEGKISILTPIGAALIGLSPGQMMMLRGADGRAHKLRVISVEAPLPGA
ncbi:nucleoside diphosphate kinase regulator [Hyphomicrobium sp. LHD-15]|uniref:nucleoside diphosphate kinase regulator n=1 Tax=Hyphomicrobium sp. LHD-15 TaxID=3072142 RepID=UPI00280CF825|nr:nucleoside diphosphate kinase regulator [Hyphomicrobium sp. LHD-15]MDQ8699469.1 nucleoside diphosphate kinase regulator [Hyphomicrobium sp. LHD-15]